jgi:hypothetical protein
MKKVHGLLSVAVAAAVMTGCGLSPVGSPTITIDPIPSIAVPSAGSVYVTVTGKIEADTAISSISYEILNSFNLPASGITVTGPQANGEEKVDFGDNPITITVFSNASAGSYKLKISVTAGPSVDATFDFTVTGSTGTLSVKTFSLGAQSAAPPSCLDADNMTPLSNTITNETTRGQVDVIFSYSTMLVTAALAFTAPDSAQGSPYDTWINKAHTQFKIVSATWDNITTQGDISSLWSSGGAASSRIPINQGDIIVIYTSNQEYKVVRISSITGSGTTATISVDGKY